MSPQAKRLLWQAHRWLALVFAIPLAVLIVTGLILSVEPILQRATIAPGALSADTILAALAAEDPDGQAQGLFYRPYDGTLTLTGPGRRATIAVATGAAASPGFLSDLFGATRRLHEHLTIAGIELTVASTCAMMALIGLGLLLGLPRLRNSLAGWHKASAWLLLPLVVLSPLTGLFIAWGVTFAGAPPPPGAPGPAGDRPRALPLAEAVRLVSASHDVSNLIWLRQQRGRQLARLWDGQEARVFAVTASGLSPLPRNLPRGLHEGNAAGLWTALPNVVVSLGFVVLFVTGFWLFGRRELRSALRRRLVARPQA